MIKIKLGTLADLIKKKGTEVENTALGTAVANNEAKYYLITKDDEIIDDFWIYLDERIWLCLYNPELLTNEQIMNQIFKQLKADGYQKIKINRNVESSNHRTLSKEEQISLKKYGFTEESVCTNTIYWFNKNL